YKPTIGVNFGISSVYLDEITVKLQIWDISYDHRVKYLRPLYFKGASGCIMVIRSLEEAKNLLKELKFHSRRAVPVLFILINDETDNPQFNDTIMDLDIQPVTSGFEGIEWLAEAMLSYQKTKTVMSAALYTVSNAEIQETIQELHAAQMRNEMESLERLREKRFQQLTIIKESLEDMDIPVEEDTVKILSSIALFIVNILTGNVEVIPIKCEECEKSCKKHGQLCIIRASEGYSEHLDDDSLLIISKIYALLTNQLPPHIINQIKNITRCSSFRPKKH
ncbi:MAG: hypothetical protein ACFFD2_30875, partial [Promethearchaeota archaeon]